MRISAPESALLFDSTDIRDYTDNALAALPNLIIGTMADDSLTGTAASDLILGLDGNDVIDAREDFGIDAEADIILAGRGNDTIHTGDNAIVLAGSGDDLAWITQSTTVLLGDGNDTLRVEAYRSGGNTVFGGAGDDVIDTQTHAVVANDRLYGGDGNDTINFIGDNTLVHGGAGNDLLYAGVDGRAPTDNGCVYGDGGDDMIFLGGSIIDTPSGTHFELDGGDGNDTIMSNSRGSDQITGGAGNDVFVFNWIEASRPADADVITDFTFNAQEQDKIDLSILSEFADWRPPIDGLPSNLTFIGYDEFSGAGREVRLVRSGDGTDVVIDMGSEGLVSIHLAGVTQELTADAFLL
ncbi:calcium-binding protein [Inquilinus sp. Marseille-Q2685]|uniref:calcium-binding protein n=1 Tax=Inquilinus sp. Marseille-Q2685 TaxID=2866581 RepID=UPI001CE481C6|nr:calcium-binding protein [Inquilinus sp. Marseille-Q2685]